MAFGLSAGAIGAIGAIGGGLIGAYGANKAANTQADAAQRAQDTQMQMYNQTREDQAPYRQAGSNALGQLSEGTAAGGQFNTPYTPYHAFNAQDFEANKAPNYDFMLGQGMGAINNQASVTGGLVGGNALKGINDYAQNYAKGAYQDAFNNYNTSYQTGFNANQQNQTNIFNRLSSIAGLGQTSNGQLSTFGQNTAGNIGSAQLAGGAARASGYVGQANALNGAVNGAASWYSANGGGNPLSGAGNYISNFGANQAYGGNPNSAVENIGT